MLIIEQIEKAWGIEFTDCQKKRLNELLTIPNNAQIRYGRDGRWHLLEDKKK